MKRHLVRTLLLVVATLLALAPVSTAGAGERVSAQVWNGTPVEKGTLPAVAAVLDFDLKGNLAGICSGTLVNARWVLTAAHCLDTVPGQEITVALGGTDIYNPDFVEVHYSSVHAVHPLWDDETTQWDVALIRLPQASAIAPVELADADDSLYWEPGTPSLITGFGSVDGAGNDAGLLRAGPSQIVADEMCADELAGVGIEYDPATMVCSDAQEADACQGDSGGPLFVVREDESLLQMGVTSFGLPCDESSSGVYAWVPQMRQWLDSTRAAGIPKIDTISYARTSAKSVRAGRRVYIQGVLLRAGDEAPLGEQRMELLRRRVGARKWVVVARQVSADDALVEFVDRPTRPYQYKIRHKATAATRAASSRTLKVTIR